MRRSGKAVTIVRTRQNGRFAALPNAIWENDGLSVEAMGTLGYLLSRPPTWRVSTRQVGKKLRVGKDRLHRIFLELIAAGYADREQPRLPNGSFGRFEYVIRDEPEARVASLPQPENPAPAEPAPVKPDAHINKTDSSNTDLTNLSLTPFRNSAPPTPLKQQGLAGEGRSKSEHQSVVQARVASRLGEGDVQKGWLMLGALSNAKRDELTAQERSGHLTDAALGEVVLNLKLSVPTT
jgi:hypothetical protein